MLAPEVFVLGTIATAAGEALCFEPLRRALAAAVWPSVARRSEIRGSALGEDGPFYAALCAALEARRRAGGAAARIRVAWRIASPSTIARIEVERLDLRAQRRQAPRADRLARALEQPQVEAQVVDRGEPRAERLARAQQVAQIGARIARAGGAVAIGVGRLARGARARRS